MANTDERYTHQSLSCSIYGTQAQVRREYLPHNLGFKPDVWFCPADLDIAARFHDLKWLQGFIVCLKSLLAESSTNFANGLILLRVGVVAGQKECTVDVCPLALAIVASNDHKIQ